MGNLGWDRNFEFSASSGYVTVDPACEAAPMAVLTEPAMPKPDHEPPLMELGELLSNAIDTHRKDLQTLAQSAEIPFMFMMHFLTVEEDAFLSLAAVTSLVKAAGIDPREVGISPRAMATWLKPTLGSLLKAHRVAAGLSQDELAKKAGVRKGSLVQWESDRRTPNFPAVVKIAKALGINVAVFQEAEFGAESEESPNE